MKLLSLFGLSLLATSVLSHPLDLPFKLSQDDIANLEKRASIIPVTGASGSTQPRYEIRQMKNKHPAQFTLLILAMQQWQTVAQSDATSYYQIAGIHGVPRQNYNNVGECSSCAGADGYCPHDSVHFPAWHRTYMALYEQQFIAVCKSIASTWPSSGSSFTKAQMTTAANAIRWPYWDWAAAPPSGQHNFPAVFSQSTITINGPSGSETIANPLFSHHFADESSLVYTPFKTWPNTLRYPSSNAASGTSNDASDVSAFDSIRGSLQDQVYQLFTNCKDYLHFSNDDAGSSTTSCSNSLEGIHNTIHTTSGGAPANGNSGGHMYYLATAAFDPLFWFHHCNVDRIFAMWQTLHPSSYGATQTAPHNTWTIAQGTSQNADSPLTPFYKDSSATTFWTANTVKDWAGTFHYTYPEFVDSDGSSTAIASYVNKLYGPSATATAGSSKRTAIPEPVAAAEAMATPEPEHSHIYERSLPANLVAANGSNYEYVANIKTNRYALDGTYIIYVFLGEPASETPSTWITDPSLVGPMGVLAQSDMKGANVTISSSLPLTRALTSKLGSGPLASLAEALVTPFLANLLSWRILAPDGSAIDPTEVPGFEIAVFASTSTQPGEEGCLPEWSDFIPLPSVTHGKPGGLANIMGGIF